MAFAIPIFSEGFAWICKFKKKSLFFYKVENFCRDQTWWYNDLSYTEKYTLQLSKKWNIKFPEKKIVDSGFVKNNVMNLLKVDGRMSDSMEASMLTQEQDQSGFGSFFGGAESSSFQVRHYK